MPSSLPIRERDSDEVIQQRKRCLIGEEKQTLQVIAANFCISASQIFAHCHRNNNNAKEKRAPVTSRTYLRISLFIRTRRHHSKMCV